MSNNDTCFQWTLGLSSARDGRSYDRECKQQLDASSSSSSRDCEPSEGDYEDTIAIRSDQTLYQVVERLCAGPVRDRRERNDDDGPTEHMWELRFLPAGMAADDRHRDQARMERLMMGGGADEEDDDRPRIELCVGPGREAASLVFDDGDQDADRVDSDEKVAGLMSLMVGGSVHLAYDMGSTTHVFLRVLSRRKVSAGRANLSAALDTEGRVERDQEDLEHVPAYDAPDNEKIDAFYPSFAKAFLSRDIGTVTLGLNRRVTREDDTTFASMESSSSGNDLLYCPLPFADMDAFLTLAEEAWSADHTEGGRIRSSFIARYLFPPTAEGKELLTKFQEEIAEDPMAECGPKKVFIHHKAVDTSDGFSFAKMFPKTNEQLVGGRFRWIRYQNGVLRVVVGRGGGSDHRDAKKSQTLRVIRREFDSLHAILCAVEASWCVPGQPTVDLGTTVLPEHDNFLGPSKPFPPDPPLLGKKEDAKIISGPNKLPRVTALAVSPLGGSDVPILYSGHEDGTLRRWDMEANSVIWSIQAFRDWSKVENQYDWCGVRSIAVREKSGKHLLYTWSHEIEQDDIHNLEPAEIRVWQGEDGKRHHTLVCKVGDDDANPLVSCVVFAPLAFDNHWEDSVVVGLQATAETYVYDSKFRQYDLEDAQDLAEGNIVSFSYQQKGSSQNHSVVRNETWRGHGGFIRAMVAINDEHCVVSLSEHGGHGLVLSEHGGHGLADEIILWSTDEPGIPLSKIILYDRGGKYPIIRSGVVGMTSYDNIILVGCGYGDIIVPVRIQANSKLSLCGSIDLKQRWYDDSSFHGTMVGNGEVSAIVNEGETQVWLYSTDIVDSPHLDRNTRSRTSSEIDDDRYDDSDDRSYKALRARSAALGKVSFARRAGGAYIKDQALSEYQSESACGGPECLALKGRYLVAGFCNGAIVVSSLLPDESPYNGAFDSGYGLKSSCSSEKEGCCEWAFLPHIGSGDDDDDDGDD